MKKVFIKIGILILFLSLSLNLVLAEPNIEVIKPQQVDYQSTSISINITSNETVDFYMKSNREIDLLSKNTTYYRTTIYGKNGNHNFTIWANNSNGIVNKNIFFKISNVSNPINITECGILSSSNTKYRLVNNISGPFTCLRIRNARNVSFNLSGHRISGGTGGGFSSAGIRVDTSPGTKIFNGDIYGALYLLDSKYHIKNLRLYGTTGLRTWVDGLLAENIEIHAFLYGIYNLQMTNTLLRNVTINDLNGDIHPNAVGILEGDSFGDMTFDNLTINSVFPCSIDFSGIHSTIKLRNSFVNPDSFEFNNFGFITENRIYKEHIAKFNVTDQNGNPLPSIVEIKDAGAVKKFTEEEAIYQSAVNPGSNKLIATDNNGKAEVWLAEELDIYRTSSPVEVKHYELSPYNFTAKTKDSSDNTNIDMNGSNSTFLIDFSLNVPNVEQLPKCTITQMLDINNDGTMNVHDGVLILKIISGQNYSISGEKGCEGIDVSLN